MGKRAILRRQTNKQTGVIHKEEGTNVEQRDPAHAQVQLCGKGRKANHIYDNNNSIFL